mmetsp:Transcript_42365/g.47964  ORF Transcript_42365/g.47964 Transcript_42365/m.47964 type:complete len:210 (-) Transcript_42365:1699-2328(-)
MSSLTVPVVACSTTAATAFSFSSRSVVFAVPFPSSCLVAIFPFAVVVTVPVLSSCFVVAVIFPLAAVFLMAAFASTAALTLAFISRSTLAFASAIAFLPTTFASRSAMAWAITVASSEALVSDSAFSLTSFSTCNLAAALAFFWSNLARSFARVSTIFLLAATTAAVVSSRCFFCSAAVRGACSLVGFSIARCARASSASFTICIFCAS